VPRSPGPGLPDLYRERIFKPLGLRQTAYDPLGPISGPHARGYRIGADRTMTDATNWRMSGGVALPRRGAGRARVQ
jgi:CubicO group peptidase (beta-lactamase class C family)